MNLWKIGLLIAAGVVGYKIYQYCNAASDIQLPKNAEDISSKDNANAMQEENQAEQPG